MTINTTDAINAFKRAQSLSGAGMSAPNSPKKSTFAEMVGSAATQMIKESREAEKMTIDAVAGKADLTDVVVALNNAQTTLQTVVAVRDRVLTAYQEILRMPI